MKLRASHMAFFCLSLTLLVSVGLPGWAETPSLETLNKHLPSVGRLRNFGQPVDSFKPGTAFYVGQGLVVTAGHVLAKSGASGRLEFFKSWSGDVSNLSIHFGITSDKPILDEREMMNLRLTRGRTPEATMIYPNRIVQEVVEAAYYRDQTTGEFRDYAILRLNPNTWPEEASAFKVADAISFKKGDRIGIFHAGVKYGVALVGGTGFYNYDEGDQYLSFQIDGGRGEPGYSGGPVASVTSGEVLGMVHSGAREPNTSTGTTEDFVIGNNVRILKLHERLTALAGNTCSHALKGPL